MSGAPQLFIFCFSNVSFVIFTLTSRLLHYNVFTCNTLLSL